MTTHTEFVTKSCVCSPWKLLSYCILNDSIGSFCDTANFSLPPIIIIFHIVSPSSQEALSATFPLSEACWRWISCGRSCRVPWLHQPRRRWLAAAAIKTWWGRWWWRPTTCTLTSLAPHSIPPTTYTKWCIILMMLWIVHECLCFCLPVLVFITPDC